MIIHPWVWAEEVKRETHTRLPQRVWARSQTPGPSDEHGMEEVLGAPSGYSPSASSPWSELVERVRVRSAPRLV